MKVCLLPSDFWGIGSYRVLFPGNELEKRGHEVFLHADRNWLAKWDPRDGNTPFGLSLAFDKDGMVERTFLADSYVFQRRMDARSCAAIRQLRRIGKHTVYELDDNYDMLPATSPGQKVFDEQPFKLKYMNEAISWADVVTVSTPALAEWYSRYNDNVVVLPNFLDWEMWRDVPLQCEVERPRVRVGWLGWLEWRGRDLEALRPWFADWIARHPEVDFVSIGERRGNAKALRKAGRVSVHDYLGVPKSQRITVKSSAFHDLAKILPCIDVGLVPLEASEFNECKSYLKGLEYAACGIPCIASPSQQYREFVREGVDGFVAARPEEWMGRLDELVGDDGLRRAMGRAAREKASAMTVQKNWKLWEAAWSPSVSTLDQAQTVSLAGSTSTTA